MERRRSVNLNRLLGLSQDSSQQDQATTGLSANRLQGLLGLSPDEEGYMAIADMDPAARAFMWYFRDLYMQNPDQAMLTSALSAMLEHGDDPNRIEHLVFNELIVIPEAAIVKDLVVINDDRIIHTAAARKAL